MIEFDFIEIIAIGALSFALAVFFATAKEGRRLLSYAVGVSAGFILVQFEGLHLYTIFAVLYVVVSRNLRKHGFLAPLMLTLAALLFASTTLYGDLVKSDGLAIQLSVMAVTTFLFWLRSSRQDNAAAVLGLLTVTTLGSVVGLMQVVGVVPMQLFQLANAEMHRPSSWYPEPDWLGLYSAVGIVLSLKLIRDGRLRFFLVALNSAAVLAASARAAWLGLVVVAVWALVRALREHDTTAKRSRKTVVLVLLVGVLFAEAVFPAQVELALDRALSAFQSGGGDSAVIARYGQIDGLLSLISTAPPYGHGISAGGRVGGFGVIDFSTGGNGNSTASNWFLALLAEGMWVAVPLILAVLTIALFGNIQLGAQAALLLVLVNSLFSNAFYFPVTWFLLAVALTPADLNSPKCQSFSKQQSNRFDPIFSP